MPIYYVSPSGNNASNGLSPQTAWQTIGKVNGSTFANGDRILFEGGATFSGAIVAPSGGESGYPITFGSYGTGRAIISSGTSYGFVSHDKAGLIVRDLIFVGTVSTNRGILIQNEIVGRLSYVRVLNCQVSGYGWDGIFIAGGPLVGYGPGIAGFEDVLIEGCEVFDCTSVIPDVAFQVSAGIMVGGSYGLALYAPSNKNVTIQDCSSHDNPGSTSVNWTGTGIIIGQTDGGLIYNCTADNNGAASLSTLGNGTVGIWTADARNITIDGCTSTNTHSLSGDGDGFDMDGGCIDCTIQNCHAEGNKGAGYLVFSYTDGYVTGNDNCKVINCTGINNSGAANVVVGGSIQTNFTISGNTLIQDGVAGTPCVQIIPGGTISGSIEDNTFILTVAGQVFNYATDNPSHVTFIGNRYLASGSYTIFWNSISYASLAAWQHATGQDQGAAVVVSYFAGHQWNAFFNFDSREEAQFDPVVGPLLTATTGLFPLAVYDLAVNSVSVLSGYWCAAVGSYPIPNEIFLQPEMQFVLDRQNQFVPSTSAVIIDNLVPPRELATLQILVPPLAYAIQGLH